MSRARIFGVLSLALLAVASVSQVQAQQAAKPAVNLSGVWSPVGVGGGGGGTSAKYPESEWSVEKLPFTAKGRAAFEANHPGKGPRLFPTPERNDPLSQANPPGLYRTLVYSRPSEIIQSADKIVQVFEWGRVWRSIYTDGRPVPKDIAEAPYWYGYSVGHWDGDTLVVNTLALDGRAWLDEWGTPFTDNARIEERWQRTAPDSIKLTITVTDPELYSKPWTSSPVIYRRQKPGVEPQEIIMAPIDEIPFNADIALPAGSKPK
jgi:hypothetical protein